MKTYNVLFELYGGVKAVNGIKAEGGKPEAIRKAYEQCHGLPVHYKDCVEVKEVEKND